MQACISNCDRATRRSRFRLELLTHIEIAARSGPGADQALDGALKDDRAALSARARTHVDDVIGDTNHLRVVFDHEDGVALVAQSFEQRVHLRHVVCMQADRRLVEHVGHICQRRADVANHLGPLRLATGQRSGRAIQAQVAQSDLDERIEAVLKVREQRRNGRLVQAAHPLGQVADLHGARVGDIDALDLRRACRPAESRAVALGAGGEGDYALDEGANVRLEGVDVPGQRRLLEFAEDTFVGDVDALGLDPDGLLVEQVIQLLLREHA